MAALSVDSQSRCDERALWLAVIQAAMRDAFVYSDTFLERNEGPGADADVIRGDAHRFLCMRWGPWAESRELVCQAAGIDAEALAQLCRRRLADWKENQRTAESQATDTLFARLVDGANAMDPETLDTMLAEPAERELVLA